MYSSFFFGDLSGRIMLLMSAIVQPPVDVWPTLSFFFLAVGPTLCFHFLHDLVMAGGDGLMMEPSSIGGISHRLTHM